MTVTIEPEVDVEKLDQIALAIEQISDWFAAMAPQFASLAETLTTMSTGLREQIELLREV